MLQQALEPTGAPDESEEERGEEVNTGEKVAPVIIIRPKQQVQILSMAEIVPGCTFQLYEKHFSLLKFEPLIILK